MPKILKNLRNSGKYQLEDRWWGRQLEADSREIIFKIREFGEILEEPTGKGAGVVDIKLFLEVGF